MLSTLDIVRWKYRYTTLLLLSIIALFLFADTPVVKSIIESIGEWGFVGAFVTGLFFVSAFTFAPALLVLYYLAEHHNLLVISILAGIGAVTGDYIILRFLKDKVFTELHGLYKQLGGDRLTRVLKTRYLHWVLPVLGAIIIASPFPDEVGIGLLGLSHLKEWQFVIIAFVLNTLGILTILGLVRII